MNIATFLRTPFFTQHLRWLFLGLHNCGENFEKGVKMFIFSKAASLQILKNRFIEHHFQLQLPVHYKKYFNSLTSSMELLPNGNQGLVCLKGKWKTYIAFDYRTLNREGKVKVPFFFKKSAFFHKKVPFLANIERCPNFLEYAFHKAVVDKPDVEFFSHKLLWVQKNLLYNNDLEVLATVFKQIKQICLLFLTVRYYILLF